ncbi:Dynamin-2B [Vitis vinifera]|uniref:dynamin GTPase n=1 Tax=Vitis vinifera TaxID=29760 RepID=A0A438GRV6_VITVI|nr:Dynamin-2B [Vitis vinifera]
MVPKNFYQLTRRCESLIKVVWLDHVGAGKSAVLNSLIGHPVLPTGENGATRAPICIDLQKDGSLSSKSIILQIDNKSQQVSASALRHSLQDRLSKGASGKSRDEIYLKLRTSTAPPLKLVDLPGLDQRIMDETLVSDYAQHNDAILLVIVPAAQAPEIASSRALKIAKEYDGDGTRTIGVISKIDQAASDQKILAAVQALLLNQGPRSTSEMPWVALIGQSVSIASAQSGSVGSENSLETAWRAENTQSYESPTSKPPFWSAAHIPLDPLHRIGFHLLQGKSQIVGDELARLGEQMVHSSEGTRAIALELCREFEDKFLLHIAGGEGAGWKVVASFEGNFPNRIKQLPLDRHFDINNVKRIVLEADGYQPYLISPEKGLRSLIKGVLELAKEPSRLCVDEVHRVLVDVVSAAANATPGLGRYPPFKREVVAIATAALDVFKNEAKKMVVALVDMERAFVPPQHFIRLDGETATGRRAEEPILKKGHEAEQSILNRATSPQTGGQQSGGSLKSMKDKSGQSEKETQEGSALKIAGPGGEITAELDAYCQFLNLLYHVIKLPRISEVTLTCFLLKKSEKTNGWSRRWFVLNEKTGKLGYTKKQEERHFRGVITLECAQLLAPCQNDFEGKVSSSSVLIWLRAHDEECNVEEVSDEEEPPRKSSKDKKANGPDSGKNTSLVFKITSKVPYKTVLKAHSAVVLKAESMADKVEWDTMVRRPADPEEELRWMSQEVRGYVEAVLNSLAANVPKAVVLCQVEKAKEDMLNQLYSSISAQSTARIEELLLEDQNVKRRRERYQKQSSLLSKLTRQLSIHDNRATAASSWSNGVGGAESSPKTSGPSGGDDWRSAFDAAANGPVDYNSDLSRSGSNGHSRHYSDPAQNGDVSSGSNSSRRTPNRRPPAPPRQICSLHFMIPPFGQSSDSIAESTESKTGCLCT